MLPPAHQPTTAPPHHRTTPPPHHPTSSSSPPPLFPAPSGSGYVLLCGDGTVSSVVVGGSNVDWPESTDYAALVFGAGIVLLQREVPEAVNMAIVRAANAQGVPVLQDAGGETTLPHCTPEPRG